MNKPDTRAHWITNPTGKRLYTVKEAAVYLGRTDWGVREIIWKGLVPEVRHGRKIYIDVLDLDRFIERNKRERQY